jgi:hypothetical protein
MVISRVRMTLDNNNNLISDIFKIVLIPFLLIDVIIFIVVLLGVSFTILPAYIDVLFLTPLSVIVIFDYVLPWFRGN